MPKKKPTHRKGSVANSPDQQKSDIPDWFTITTVEQLKSVANDLRLKIIGELAQKEQTAKQVAENLGEPPTKLYHHVDALASAGLIKPTKTVPKRGTTQHFYRAVAKRFRVDDSCFQGSSNDRKLRKNVVNQLLESIHNDLGAISADQDPYFAAVSALCQLSPTSIEKLASHLIENLTSMSEELESKTAASEESAKYRVSILIHPIAE